MTAAPLLCVLAAANALVRIRIPVSTWHGRATAYRTIQELDTWTLNQVFLTMAVTLAVHATMRSTVPLSAVERVRGHCTA